MDAPVACSVECPNCGRLYRPKGLASHRRKCDRENLNNDIVVTKKVNARWSSEESYFLARTEADALLRGAKPKEIHKILGGLLVGDKNKLSEGENCRTAGGIKGQRGKQDNKDLVQRLVAEGTRLTVPPEASRGTRTQRGGEALESAREELEVEGATAEACGTLKNHDSDSVEDQPSADGLPSAMPVISILEILIFFLESLG
ncbi:unnamed protein product [Ixodes pacificus]